MGDSEYEDLLSLWSDLEAALSMLLLQPLRINGFSTKVMQLDRWMKDLVVQDTDAALYLMFQLASTSAVGYSAAHALVCGTLCHVVANALALPSHERDSLVRAALTMNISMTEMQDVLAEQRERPTSAQQDVINRHPIASQTLLQRLFVDDALWLELVGMHHQPLNHTNLGPQHPPTLRLLSVLQTVDRYAAMISPRKYRAGKTVMDTLRDLSGATDLQSEPTDEATKALISAVGLCPPGTFVQLNNGEIAVVLRRSQKDNYPLVASLVDQHGVHRMQPYLYATASGKQTINTALSHSMVTLKVNHRTMVRLGLYAAQRSPGLMGLLHEPSAL